MRGVGQVLEYRRRRNPPNAFYPRLLLPFAFLALQATHPVHMAVQPWHIVLPVILLLAARWALHMHRGHTLVGPHGITVRTAVFTRRLAWSSVYSVAVKDLARRPQGAVDRYGYVRTVNGRAITLPHVDNWQMEDVDAQVAAIRAAGTRYAGLTWRTRPEMTQAIRRRVGLAKARDRSLLTALVVWCGMFTLWAVLRFTDIRWSTQLLLLWVPLAVFALVAAVLHRQWESQVPENEADW
ncbi:hypothetical protein ACFCX0_21295 [Streptomyces sp. NPDC056352]|uniref:hypothetical protein n=1 Tax=Streptomyces sp. NPDC056352 TaxID=3345791 RepID=UPI0035D6B6BF